MLFLCVLLQMPPAGNLLFDSLQGSFNQTWEWNFSSNTWILLSLCKHKTQKQQLPQWISQSGFPHLSQILFFFFFKLLFIISWSSVSFWRVYTFPPEQHAKPQLTLRRGKQFANDVFNPGSTLSIQCSFFFHMSITICGTCLEQWMSELHLYSSGLRVCSRGRTSRPLFK